MLRDSGSDRTFGLVVAHLFIIARGSNRGIIPIIIQNIAHFFKSLQDERALPDKIKLADGRAAVL